MAAPLLFVAGGWGIAARAGGSMVQEIGGGRGAEAWRWVVLFEVRRRGTGRPLVARAAATWRRLSLLAGVCPMVERWRRAAALFVPALSGGGLALGALWRNCRAIVASSPHPPRVPRLGSDPRGRGVHIVFRESRKPRPQANKHTRHFFQKSQLWFYLQFVSSCYEVQFLELKC